VGLDMLEQNPTSNSRRAVIQEDLANANADRDRELLHQAKAVLDAIQHYAPETVNAVGVELEDIKGSSLIIQRVIATGTGVRAKQVDMRGDIRIQGVQAGSHQDTFPKPEGQ